MMDKQVSAADANRSLSLLLREVKEEGRRFVITSHGRPVAMLGPIDPEAVDIEARAASRRAHLEAIAKRLKANPRPDIGRQWTRDELYER